MLIGIRQTGFSEPVPDQNDQKSGTAGADFYVTCLCNY